VGNAFVTFYYRHSPPVANFIGKHETIKGAVRFTLTPIVYGIEHPYISGAGLIIPAGMMLIYRRKIVKKT
jgi:hypothetical protein